MVAGVCMGVAEYFGMDVTLLRVIVAVVAVITGGAGFLAYLAAWAIIPSEGDKSSARTRPRHADGLRPLGPAAREACVPRGPGFRLAGTERYGRDRTCMSVV
jgi:phage shock protein PspC (stress-responsive transcriptional regulator)